MEHLFTFALFSLVAIHTYISYCNFHHNLKVKKINNNINRLSKTEDSNIIGIVIETLSYEQAKEICKTQKRLGREIIHCIKTRQNIFYGKPIYNILIKIKLLSVDCEEQFITDEELLAQERYEELAERKKKKQNRQ